MGQEKIVTLSKKLPKIKVVKSRAVEALLEMIGDK